MVERVLEDVLKWRSPWNAYGWKRKLCRRIVSFVVQERKARFPPDKFTFIQTHSLNLLIHGTLVHLRHTMNLLDSSRL